MMMAQWECSMSENVAECLRMVRCPGWWLLWSEDSPSEGTGLRKLTSHNLRSVCWTGIVNWNCMWHCPLRTWVPQSMFMLHTEMSGGEAQKSILRIAVSHFHSMQRDTFAFWYVPVKWRCTKMDVYVCLCVCVDFLFLSLYIQTVSNNGSILETLT